MPTLTITIEDTAPVILYSNNGGGGSDWEAGSSESDPFLDQYSDSTFMVTQTNNASASFTFFGTGVQLYGGKRPGHGLFQVTIDSLVYPPTNGSSPTPPGVFQTALFSTVALQAGYHTVTITNNEAKLLDIDFITYQTPVSFDDNPLIVTTVQDYDSPFVYTPASAWSTEPSNLGMFSAGSGHVTTTGGTFATFTFQKIDTNGPGNSVAIFGPVGPNGAPYAVQLDNSPPSNYSAFKTAYRAQQMLFQAGDIGSGKHTVRIESFAPNNSAAWLAIDYAQVFAGTAGSSELRNGLSIGAAVGISIGSMIGVGLLVLLLVWLWRHRTRSSSHFISPMGLPSAQDRPLSSQHLLASPRSQSFPRSPGSWNSYNTVHTEENAHLLYVSEASADENGQNVQTITIPYTPDRKYRPDLFREPQVMPPPAGSSRRIRSNDNYSASPSLASRDISYTANVHQPIPDEMILHPLRRVDTRPPEYER